MDRNRAGPCASRAPLLESTRLQKRSARNADPARREKHLLYFTDKKMQILRFAQDDVPEQYCKLPMLRFDPTLISPIGTDNSTGPGLVFNPHKDISAVEEGQTEIDVVR